MTMYGDYGVDRRVAPPDAGIVVLFYGDFNSPREELLLELKQDGKALLASEIVELAVAKLEIGTLAFPLYFLYDLERRCWLHPRVKVPCSATSRSLFVLRARCLPSPYAIVNNLFPGDVNFSRYFFLQTRHDFLNNNLQFAKDKHVGQEHVLGFVVMDLVRYGKTNKLDVKQIENLDLKHFIPFKNKELLKFAWDKHRLRNNIRPHLKAQHEKYKDYSSLKLMLNFILGLIKYLEGYGSESFEVGHGQRVFVDPYHPKFPGVYTGVTVDKSSRVELIHFSKIEKLKSLSPVTMGARDNHGQPIHSVLLHRMDGTPVDLCFLTLDIAQSFMCLLNTYHRLLEDFHYQLCENDVGCPVLAKLNRLPSHGPVSKLWAQTRLREKYQIDVAFNYMLKQTSKTVDSLVLVYIRDLPHVEFYLINKLQPSGYQLGFQSPSGDLEPTFPSLFELLQYYRQDKQPLISLKKCVRPYGPLDKRLYVCRDDSSLDTAADVAAKPQKSVVTLVSRARVGESRGTGHFTEVYVDRDNAHYVVKRLRKEDQVPERLQYLVKSAHIASFWSYATIISIHAICLAPNFCLIMENGIMGNLERYLFSLKGQNKTTTNYVLIMVAEQLAQALLYLDGIAKGDASDCCHGNIRTRNVLVFGHEERLLKVKLGDPGMVYLYNTLPREDAVYAERLPWIAPELYKNREAMNKLSDRWAYGITIWEIMSRGERPYKYLNMVEIEKYVRDGHTLQKPVNCPDEIYRIMQRCWAGSPEDRMSPKEMVRDICNLIQSDYRPESLYTDPKWDDKESSGKSKTRRFSQRRSDNKTTATTTVVATTTAAENRSFETSASMNSFQGGGGGVGPEDEWSDSTTSPSSESNLSWNSATPLMSPTSRGVPLAGSSASSFGSGTSADTLTTDLGTSAHDHLSHLSLCDDASAATGRPIRLKDNLPETPDMPEPVKPLNHENLLWNPGSNQDLKNQTLLGAGHYGEVYKGFFVTNHGNPRPVAIKRLKPEMYNQFSVEFEREFQIMIPLKHPNIVEIIGHCPMRDQHNPMLLVMEFVENGALKLFMQKNQNSLEVGTMIRFAKEIAEGMLYLSNRRIYHRDLAARNVLVTGDRRMKITDFGLAKAIETDKTYYRMNKQKEFPLYWYAPEAINYKYNALSDVWSFGVTIWEIFTYGKPPEYNCNIKDLPQVLYKGTRLKDPENCPEKITQLMAKCWEFDHEKRINFAQVLKWLDS